MNYDIIWGLRNAVERGSTLDQAVKSYTNAGYSEVEVKEAVNFLTSGSATLMTNPKREENKTEKVSQEPGMGIKTENAFPKLSTPVVNNAISQISFQKTSMSAQTAPVRPIIIPATMQKTQSNVISQEKQYSPIIPPSAMTSLDQPSDELRRKRRKNAVLILTILLLILIIALGGVFYFQDEILKYLSTLK